MVTLTSLRASYAADLLFIVTLGFAKLSMTVLFRNLTEQGRSQRLHRAAAMFIGVWMLVSFLAQVFSCSTPNVWDFLPEHCYNRVCQSYGLPWLNSWNPDRLASGMPLVRFISWRMWCSSSFRSASSSIFKCRSQRKYWFWAALACAYCKLFISYTDRAFKANSTSDIGVAVAQISFTNAFSSDDFILNYWRWALVAQISMCITILTSCLPYIRPLLASFPSGMLMADEVRRRGDVTTRASKYYKASGQGYILQNVDSRGNQEHPVG